MRRLLPIAALFTLTGKVFAAGGNGGGAIPVGPLLGATLSTGPNGPTISAPVQIVILLTLLALLPAAMMCLTPFLRISIVLHFLRQALGTQSAPSNQVLVGLSLFLSILVMQPVARDIYQKGWQPYDQGKLTMDQALIQGQEPLRHFLFKFAREKDIQLFVGIAHEPQPRTPQDLDIKVLIPAYIVSELKASFQIGTVLFLPFMVIDVVIASITISMGMMQLPPAMLSAPFKILLFVLVDGWDLVIGSLMKGLYP
jgi:flagellar biosynthetic protein FliP